MNRRTYILSGIVVIVAVSVLWFLLQRQVDVAPNVQVQRQPDPSTMESGETRATDAPISSVDRKPQTSTPASGTAGTASKGNTLPTPDTPISDYFDELAERARSGDEQAGCRLSLDLQLCAMQPMFQDGVNSYVEFAAETPSGSGAEERSVTHGSYFSTLAERAALVCDGLTPAQLSSSWQYMLTAANQGSVTAAVRFAGFPPMMSNINNFAMDAEAWAAYRDNAPHLLEFAAQQGDPRAMFLLYGLLSGRDTLIGFPDGFFERDLIRATAYALALMPIADGSTRQGFERRLEEARGLLSETEMLQARQMAEQMGATLSQREPVIDFASGIFNRLEPEDCEDL